MNIQAVPCATHWLWWSQSPQRGSLLLLDDHAAELEILGPGRALWRHPGTGKALAWIVVARA